MAPLPGGVFIYKHMYKTYEQTLHIISGGKKYTNKNYANTRIRTLVSEGKLKSVSPEIFVKDDNGNFINLGNIRTQPLVTDESISEFMRTTPLGNHRPIKAVFSDGSESKFSAIMDACKFFGLRYDQIQKHIETNTAHHHHVSVVRANELGVEFTEDLTEAVKFKRI